MKPEATAFRRYVVHWALYGLNVEWLLEHSPDSRFARSSRKDWKTFDAETYPLVGKIVEQILELRPAKRVTANLIGKMLGWKDRLAGKYLKKMKSSWQEVEKYRETHESFAIRRIKLASASYLEETKLPTESQLMKRAGLSESVRTEYVLAELKRELENLKNLLGDTKHDHKLS